MQTCCSGTLLEHSDLDPTNIAAVAVEKTGNSSSVETRRGGHQQGSSHDAIAPNCDNNVNSTTVLPDGSSIPHQVGGDCATDEMVHLKYEGSVTFEGQRVEPKGHGPDDTLMDICAMEGANLFPECPGSEPDHISPPTSSPPISTPSEIFPSSPTGKFSQRSRDDEIVEVSSPLPPSSPIPDFDPWEKAEDKILEAWPNATPSKELIPSGANEVESSILEVVSKDVDNTRDRAGLTEEGGLGSAAEAEKPNKIQHSSSRPVMSPKFAIPNPKRPTTAAQQLQHKKLAKPFRTPTRSYAAADKSPISYDATPKTSKPEDQKHQGQDHTAGFGVDLKLRHRSAKAGAQFKSPLHSVRPLNDGQSIRLTPTIQVLERQLNLLKRAVKIKQDGDKHSLETLVDKWTGAGRETAWELWRLVKDRPYEETAPGVKRSFQDDWGWAEQAKATTHCESSRSDPIAFVDRHTEENGNTLQNSLEQDQTLHNEVSLGMMLCSLGIAAETLGWNELEADFQ